MVLQPVDKLTIQQTHISIADPHIASDNKDGLNLRSALTEALVRLDDQGHFVPSLAERWTLADDACTWTFTLRQNVRYHNGDMLNAQDVVASIERACDPSLGGELGTEGLYYSYLKEMTIAVLDEQTVQLATATPMADLLDLLVDIPAVPEQTFAQLPENLISSGPYRVVEVSNDRVVMEAFDDYWGGTPPIRIVNWLAEPDAQRRVEALLAGQADLITQVPLQQRQVVAEAPTTTLVVAPSSVCVAFMCNAQEGVCTDRRVRQALNYALDMSAIVNEVMDGTAEPLNGPLTSLHFGYDPHTPPYPYDPDRARTLLAEAGYGDGLTLVLDVPTILPDEAQHLAQLMASYYADVGITTEIKAFADRPGYANRVKAKQIDDACSFDSSPLSTFRPLREKFHGGIRGPWWQGYVNPEVDQLLDQVQLTVNISERQEIYRQAYRLIRNDAPWIFLYSPTIAWGVGPCVRGWKPTRDALIGLQ
ncbi:ABC transporter substrate-binding protein [Chloroflexi bacterium TSY]|nr:ABC transporter substrate-binding protein [Chloroflexi bacterium TSY]